MLLGAICILDPLLQECYLTDLTAFSPILSPEQP